MSQLTSTPSYPNTSPTSALPSSSNLPRPHRSNSLSSDSQRHVKFSLARMASHETTELHPSEEDETAAEERNDGRGRVRLVENAVEEGLEATTGRIGDGEDRTPTPREVEEGLSTSSASTVVIRDETHSQSLPDSEYNNDKQHDNPSDQTQVEVDKVHPALMDQTNLLPVKQVILVFAGLSAALFCSLLDQTIVSTALPTLGKVFNNASQSSWVATSYLVTSTAAQPMYGRFSDIFGRKVVLLVALAIFGIGSIACAVAQTMIQLIVFRALSGIGGGGILTLVMIIVSDVISLKERGKYQGILGGVVALSNSIGPILGGAFAEAGRNGWRWCFWINVPMTVASIIVCIWLLPLKRKRGDVKKKLSQLDYAGSILTLAWAVLILLPISWGGQDYPWASAGVLAPLLIGVALLVLFIWVEWKWVALPIIPIYIFNDRTVNAAMVSTFFSGCIFYETLYVLPQFFQVVKGVSALRSGVLMLPLILVQTVTSFTSGLIVSKTGDYRANLWVGFAIWTIGTGLLSTIDQNTTLGQQIGYQILTGVGAGQTFQTSLVAIQATVARKDMATATGTRNFIRLLGGSIALALSTAILNNSVRRSLESAGMTSSTINTIIADPTQIAHLALTATEKVDAINAYVHGIHNIFYFLIPCAGISFFLVLFFVKAHSLKRDDDAALKEEGKAWAEKQKAKHGHGHGSKHPSPTSSRKASVVDIGESHAEKATEDKAGSVKQ